MCGAINTRPHTPKRPLLLALTAHVSYRSHVGMHEELGIVRHAPTQELCLRHPMSSTRPWIMWLQSHLASKLWSLNLP